MIDPTGIAEELSTRVYDCIHQVLAEKGGGLVDGFVLWVNFTDADGHTAFANTCAPDQRMSTTVGIVRMLEINQRKEIETWLESEDE